MGALRQTNFSAGELSRALYGRNDLEQFNVGLRRLLNGYVTRQGSIRSRPGTLFVAECMYPSVGSIVRGFRASSGVGFLLEFTDAAIRIYRDDVLVRTVTITKAGGPVPYYYDINVPLAELLTTSSSLSRCTFTQFGDVLSITNPYVAPHELVFLGPTDADWELRAVDFDHPMYFGGAIPGGGWKGGIGVTPASVAPTPVGAPTRNWEYRWTLILEYANGTRIETLPGFGTRGKYEIEETDAATIPMPDTGNMPLLINPTAAAPLTLRFEVAAASNRTAGFGFRQVSTRIYRGRSGIFGLVGEVPGAQERGEGPDPSPYVMQFIDYGDEPDYTIAPPTGRNPFTIYSDTGNPPAVLRVEYPGALTYFESRSVYGGTFQRPGRLWCSRINDYLNFDRPTVLLADSPIELELASYFREQIMWMVGLERLIVGTDSSIYIVGGEDPLSAISQNQARMHIAIGSRPLQPVAVNGTVLYVREKGSGVQAIAFSNERRSYDGGDVSMFAEHLFKGRAVRDWCFQKDPEGLIWLVMEDGAMLSLTYNEAMGVVAFGEHLSARGTAPGGDTGFAGFIESCCSVPGVEEDTVYLVVHRTVSGVLKRYIEKLATRNFDTAAEAVCLDSAVQTANPATTVIPGHAHLAGAVVWANADGQVIGPKVVSGGDVDLTAELDGIAPDLVTIGLRYEVDVELLDVADRKENPKIVKRVLWEIADSRGFFTGTVLPVSGSTEGLDEWQQREIERDAYDPLVLFTGVAEVAVQGGWDKEGRACIRQVDPMPLEIVGVTRDGSEGGGGG